MKPIVSVLIAAYNAEEWLPDTLRSVLNQTWESLEVIVVDDGSRDQTYSVAQSFDSARVKVIRQENQGQCAASNRCLEAAQGDFIQYLDADDLLAPNKIELQMQMLSQAPAGYLASGEWARFFAGIDDANFIPQKLWADFNPIDWLLCAWENHLMMHGAAWLLPRPVVDAAGPWDTRLSLINDFDYFSRVVMASQGVKFCHGARSYYRSGLEHSLSHQASDTARLSAFISLNKGTSNLLALDSSDRAQKVCANVLQRFVFEVYPAVPELRQQAEDRIKELGGASEQPIGGPVYQAMMAVLGWKRAKVLKEWMYDVGYQKLALGRFLVSS